MKSLLALITLALVALVVEEKGRQLAGDARDTVGEASATLSGTVERQPVLSLLVAGALAYALASVIPSRG
jgi:hypothetical protein